MIVLLEDECHLVWGDVCGMAWGKRNAPLVVPMTNERQRQTYYGALNLLTQEFHVYEASAGNGVNTVAYLQWCQTLYPDKPLGLALGWGQLSSRGGNAKVSRTGECRLARGRLESHLPALCSQCSRTESGRGSCGSRAKRMYANSLR